MAARYLIAVASCLYLALQVNGLQTVNGKIKVTVQTTAGCGDTVRFIRDVLAPTYDLYKEYLIVEFVPWGRARRAADGTLTCQFGARDCWANRLNRCTLNVLKDNQDAQVKYMACEFTSPFPAFNSGSFQCVTTVGLSQKDVEECVATPGDQLELDAEIRGTEYTQAINFIPSIIFNDTIDKKLHDQALRNFKSMVCSALAADPTTGVTSC